MKCWEAKAKLNRDMQHIVTIYVKANTERKAIMFAQEKARKTYNCLVIDIISIKETETKNK